MDINVLRELPDNNSVHGSIHFYRPTSTTDPNLFPRILPTIFRLLLHPNLQSKKAKTNSTRARVQRRRRRKAIPTQRLNLSKSIPSKLTPFKNLPNLLIKNHIERFKTLSNSFFFLVLPALTAFLISSSALSAISV
jgi:hypothetical protein